MSYIFKYHPDNIIYINGKYECSYTDFINQHPDFPIIEGNYFEYSQDKLELINNDGHHLPQDISGYQELIQAIEAL